MGMFDTIHTDEGCGQVKCFGNLLTDYRIGDAVTLRRSLEPAEHKDLYERIVDGHVREGLDGVALQMAVASDPRSCTLLSGEPTDDDTYQVKMIHGGGFIQVRDGVLHAWGETFDVDLPCYDSYGRVVAVIGVVGSRSPLQRELCDECRVRPVLDSYPATESDV
jgi:hypothetical protein